MKPIQDLIKRVRAMERSINPSIKRTINKNKKLIKVQVTERQLYLGVDANDIVIEPEYTPFTIALKDAAGQLSDRVTLRDTGALYRSLQVSARKDYVSFSVTVPYFDDLQDKYIGNQLLGLNPAFRLKLTKEEIVPNVITKFKEILSK